MNRVLSRGQRRMERGARRLLGTYRIRLLPDLWEQAVGWAAEVARSYTVGQTWPMPHQLASQYLLLLLAKLKREKVLKLAPRAEQRMPDAVRAALAGGIMPALPALPASNLAKGVGDDDQRSG